MIGFTGCDHSDGGKYNEFAQCVTDSGAVFYGTEWCPHCKDQKAMFGDALEKIKFIDCDRNKLVCETEGITGYPTWKFSDGSSASGAQPLTRLGEITGCELPVEEKEAE